jgi:tetratricopeptide (TPR) repeat protein
VTLDQSLLPDLAVFLALFGVPVDDPGWQGLDPMLWRRRTLDAVTRLLLRESAVQPLLVVFEDLHWIDGETQAFLDGLVEVLPGARVLLAVNYRPEYRHGWGSKTYYTPLRLDALATESAEALLLGLLGSDRGLAALTPALIKRTEGNPLFIEECVRDLAETRVLTGERGAYRLTTAVDRIQMPPSVQALLAARIDRLSADDKHLLQVAAVIGKDVPVRLVDALAGGPEPIGGGLARLQAAEFLYATSLYPEAEYTFKHALTHEVAYASVLQDRRRAIHGEILALLERTYAGRLAEQVERLGHHALRAEAWAKALDYLGQARARAAARSAGRELVACCEQAMEALSHLPESREVAEQAIDVRLALRGALGALGEFEQAFAVASEAEALARQLDDRPRLGWASAGLAITCHLTDRDPEARQFGDNALALGRELADAQLQGAATQALALICFNAAEPASTVRLGTEAIALLGAPARADLVRAGTVQAVVARHFLARALGQLGEFGEGIRHAHAALEIAEGLGHPYSIVLGSVALGHLYTERGDVDQARPLLERSLLQCRDLDLRLYRGVASFHLGEAHARGGRVSDALRQFEETLDAFAEMRTAFRKSYVWSALAEANIYAARLDDARGYAEGTLAWASQHGYPGWEPVARQLIGLAATRSDPPDVTEAEAQLRRALALAADHGRRPLVARCHLGLGELYRKAGKRDLAREHLAVSRTMLRDMAMSLWLAQAETEAAQLDAG